MSIRPVLISGMIQRTDDIGLLKHQEDAKPQLAQQNAQTQVVKKTHALSHQVQTPENGNKADTHADAREEGRNTYFYRKKSAKNKQGESATDIVIPKSAHGSFDIKV